MNQLEERQTNVEESQTNVEDTLAGMKKNMATMSLVESIAQRKLEEMLAKQSDKKVRYICMRNPFSRHGHVYPRALVWTRECEPSHA